jgi:hypothetical protein
MEKCLAQPIFRIRHSGLKEMAENGFFHSGELTRKINNLHNPSDEVRIVHFFYNSEEYAGILNPFFRKILEWPEFA